jgi:hypothetical protein
MSPATSTGQSRAVLQRGTHAHSTLGLGSNAFRGSTDEQMKQGFVGVPVVVAPRELIEIAL